MKNLGHQQSSNIFPYIMLNKSFPDNFQFHRVKILALGNINRFGCKWMFIAELVKNLAEMCQ